MVRTAFGMEYIIPRSTIAGFQASRGDSPQWPLNLTAAGEMDPQLGLGNNFQRLSVFVQLASRHYDSESTLDLGGSRIKADKQDLTKQDTIIVFDSMNDAAAVDELISGDGPWQNLSDEPSLAAGTIREDLFVRAMQLLFDALAGKWSEYILRMHGFVSALAEDIYDEPANDEPSSTLWSVSKQLLQAERLLKSQIRLCETIQSEYVNAIGPNALRSDWLQQELIEFRRLGDEVEETLQKPVAQTLDLVRHLIWTTYRSERAHNHTHRCINR